MYVSLLIFRLPLLSAAILVSISAFSNVRAQLPITYQVEIDSHHQLFLVTMRIRSPKGRLHLSLPTTTPGSASLENNARYVLRFRATDGDGRQLHWRRLDKQTWEIDVLSSGWVSARYVVHSNTADTLRLASNQLDEHGGFFCPGSVLMYSRTQLPARVALQLKLPAEWKLVTPLEKRGDYLVARNYRELVNSPVQFGTLETRAIAVGGTSWRLIFDKQLPNYDVASFDQNLQKIIKSEIQMLGSAPFREFIVFFHWRPDLEYGGGMEFGKAMIINIGKEWMEDLPDDVSGTFAHETFHMWNAIAFYPKSFHDWDYSRENYTELMWFQEGITSYFAVLAMVRGGVRPTRFFEMISNAVSSYENQKGRGYISISDASVADWINPIETIDVYSGGEVIGFLLDLEIRSATNNAKSLDDMMRLLYRQSKAVNYRGYDERDLVEALNGLAGRDVVNEFMAYVHGKGRINYAAVLKKYGLTVESARTEDGSQYTLRLTKQLNPEQVEFWKQVLSAP